MPPLTPDQAIAQAAQFGPFVYVMVIVILLGAAGFAAHFKWVILPEKQATRENTAKLTNSVVDLKEGTACLQDSQRDMHLAIAKIAGPINTTHDHTRRLVAAAKPIAVALQKVADSAAVDIRSEMGEIHGIFHAGD